MYLSLPIGVESSLNCVSAVKKAQSIVVGDEDISWKPHNYPKILLISTLKLTHQSLFPVENQNLYFFQLISVS